MEGRVLIRAKKETQPRDSGDFPMQANISYILEKISEDYSIFLSHRPHPWGNKKGITRFPVEYLLL